MVVDAGYREPIRGERMPRSSIGRLGPAPRADPARYPGDRLAGDFLLLGTQVRPLPAGESWTGGRSPVVAFGSNAAPAQLVAKFGPTVDAIPVTRARLHGFALAHSPHVSTPGYIPWVLVDRRDTAVDCTVLWLDDVQRARLDVTEPNYTLTRPDAARHPLQVAAVHARVDCLVYRGRWGALRWPDEPGPAPAGSQAEVFGRLGALDWFRGLVGAGSLGAVQRGLAADPMLRDRVRRELATRGMVVADGWVLPG